MNVTASLQSTAKPWWASRTLWFNLLVAVAAAAEAGFGVLQPLLPVNAFAALTFLLTVGNAALRVLTTSSLVLRGPTPLQFPPLGGDTAAGGAGSDTGGPL